MPTVFIPTMLQQLTGGLKQVDAPGETVADLIDNLESAHPGIKPRLVDGDALRSNLAVAVDGEVSVLGLLEDVPEGAEVHFIPAISGGRSAPSVEQRNLYATLLRSRTPSPR